MHHCHVANNRYIMIKYLCITGIRLYCLRMGLIMIGFLVGLKKIIIFDENSGESGLVEVALLS